MKHAEPGAYGRGPVVVLAYAYSGVEQIEDWLVGHPDLACTTGTGILPLCAEGAGTWERIDGQAGPLSPLASSSLRALVGCMTTVILARSGGSRWCEISFTPPAIAETFWHLYPGARFLCWHRNSQDVIRAAVEANPWGLVGRGLAPYVALYPGNTAAAVAAYWAERTEALLRFEDAHPDACRRVRHEDLTGFPEQYAAGLSAFLGLEPAVSQSGPARSLAPDRQFWPTGDDGHIGQNGSGQGTRTGGPLPAGLLPEMLADQVDSLQARLGYAPLDLLSPAG